MFKKIKMCAKNLNVRKINNSYKNQFFEKKSIQKSISKEKAKHRIVTTKDAKKCQKRWLFIKKLR